MSVSKQEILDAFRFRHACKEFDASRKICDEDFAFILETARLSPSSFGIEPWKFLVVQNPELREKLKVHAWGGQKQLPTASHVIVTLVRKSFFMRYDSDFVRQFMRNVQKFPEEAAAARTGILEKFQRHDFKLLDSERAMNDWSTKQTYLPMANMMTAAALIGIDSCPIEGFERASLEQVLAEEMAIDLERWCLSYLLAFGYRKGEPARAKTRQEMDAVVEWFL
ncbi:MAG: NAD(P)H-dependent oxidoreductase [Methylomonas sp.]